MAKMIQIRNVPDTVHRVLKARAAREGMSLSDYIKRELSAQTKRPTMEEWLDEIRLGRPARPGKSAVQIIRELRGE